MKLVIASSVDRVEKALAAGKTDQLKAIAGGASQVVGKLIDVVGAIVHGSEATHDQAETDNLLGD
jgi:hypothetical protein